MPESPRPDGPLLITCRRTGRAFDLDEHERCPWCWGSRERVASGDHAQFCDFEPGKDPLLFGFPEGLSRDEKG